MKTSFLTQQIKHDLGGYVCRKKYLSKWELVRKLRLMGYGSSNAAELADYIQERIDSAFERAVFVVSARTINLTGIAPQTPSELLSILKGKEPEAFDPMKWYMLSDFIRDLDYKNYDSVIISELAPYILRHVRAAFLRGINGAASKLVALH